jgi:hypothetical protein
VFWKIAFKNNVLIGLRTKSLFGWCFAHFCSNVFIYYFIILRIIIFLQSTPTSTTATDKHSHRQPLLATIHQQNQQSQQHTHWQPHLDPLQDPPQINKTQPQLQQNPTISHHRPTNLHREREGSVPSRAALGERERSASDRRSPAPPRSLLRSPGTTAKLHHREERSEAHVNPSNPTERHIRWDRERDRHHELCRWERGKGKWELSSDERERKYIFFIKQYHWVQNTKNENIKKMFSKY